MLDRISPAALALVAVSFAFRLPPLLNAPGGVNSDASVVGLQAMHILGGEWSFNLWGSDYQTSVDSLVAVFWYLLIPSKPLALVLSTVVGHVILTLAVFSMLRRRFEPWPSFLLSLPLVFTAEPVHTYVLHPPRQAALTLVFVALWVIDRAADARHSLRALAIGALISGLSCYADPFAFVFLPGVMVFSVFVIRSLPREQRRPAYFAGAFAALIGLVPYFVFSFAGPGSGRVVSLTPEVVARNFRLLHEQCLPFALSLRAWISPNHEPSRPWVPPAGFSVVQWLGAIALVGGTLAGGVLALSRKLPTELRRLGAIGAVVLPVTLLGFLFSPMVMGLFSARYLAPIILVSPFALAPVLWLVKTRKMTLMLAPYLVSAAVAGWLEYGSDVDGFRPRLDNGRALDEHQLREILLARSIKYAIADYWAAYRLTFLYEEQLIVVPFHERQNRYRPYRERVEAAPVLAYVYDPWRSDEDFAAHEASIRAGQTPYEPNPERLQIGRFSVLILTRKGPIPSEGGGAKT